VRGPGVLWITCNSNSGHECRSLIRKLLRSSLHGSVIMTLSWFAAAFYSAATACGSGDIGLMGSVVILRRPRSRDSNALEFIFPGLGLGLDTSV